MGEKVVKNPILWVSTVYFAMGIPMTLISDVSLLMFKDMGISDAQITFWASLLVLPWSLKPLWSPLMQVFGTKKQYVVISEILSALMLGFMFFSLGLDNFFATTLVLMTIMAVSGSVHDIAGDGTYMEHLNKTQQSMYIGWQGAFYNLARILARGGLVYLVGVMSHRYGLINSWQAVMAIAGVVLLAVGIYHFVLLPGRMRVRRVSENETVERGNVFRELWEVIVSFFRKRYILYYLVFILLYRFTEGLATKVAPLFLKAERGIGGLGLSNEQYGLIYGTIGTAAFILGSILSGYYISRFGLKRVIFSLALIFNLPFLVYYLLAHYMPESIYVIGGGIVAEYFTYGFGFVGLNLFMMQQIAPGKHQMAHYAIGTSLMNLSMMIPGMMSGWISDKVGYETFFLIAVLVAIPGLICTYFLPFTYDDGGKEVSKT